MMPYGRSTTNMEAFQAWLFYSNVTSQRPSGVHLKLLVLLLVKVLFLSFKQNRISINTCCLGSGQSSIVSAGGHTALIPLLSSSAPQVSSLAVSALAGLSATTECATAIAESGSIQKVASIMSTTQVSTF